MPPPGEPLGQGELFAEDYVLDGVKLGPPFVKENIEKVIKLDFDKTDVLIVGYPKSGKSYCNNINTSLLFLNATLKDS